MQTSFLSEIIDGFSGNSLPFHLQPLVEVPSLRRGENPGTCYRQYQLSLIKLNFSVAWSGLAKISHPGRSRSVPQSLPWACRRGRL